jgi:SAM-dependent methyltransferase
VVARARQWLAWALRPPLRSKPGQLRTILRIKRSGSFDEDLYLARYNDVALAGIDPVLHYVDVGAREGRTPGRGGDAGAGRPRGDSSYAARVDAQIGQYSDPDAIGRLPPIYHHWTHRHLIPKVVSVFGRGNLFEIYAAEFSAALSEQSDTRDILSLGCGDADTDIKIARAMREGGAGPFRIHGLELSEHRLARAREAVEREGLGECFSFAAADLNAWRADRRYAGVFAHHTLHHVAELEHLFSEVEGCLHPRGRFVLVDMIGRNGHMRWPEALHWIEFLWRFIPSRYKYHHRLMQQHDEFVNWDCSTTGFEGIRAQDILPLLLERFDFSHFLGFGGIIDPFIERGYGPNLRVEDPDDLAFLDFVEELNDLLLDVGAITPTMAFGVARAGKGAAETICWRELTPEDSVRSEGGEGAPFPGLQPTIPDRLGLR